MGYYTQYSLDTDDSPWSETFWDDFENEDPKVMTEYGSPPPANTRFDFADPCKWYGWKQDMETISKNYPNVLFTLHAEGEESGDLWVAYIMNGESQVYKAEVVYPKPNLEAFTRVDVPDPIDLQVRTLEAEIKERQLKIEELKSANK